METETPSTKPAAKPKEGKEEKDIDSLGQENPARDLERKNISEAQKSQEEKAKKEKEKEKEAAAGKAQL